MNEKALLEELFALEERLKQETDFSAKLEIKDEILDVKKKLGMIKPPDSPYECEGCSA